MPCLQCFSKCQCLEWSLPVAISVLYRLAIATFSMPDPHQAETCDASLALTRSIAVPST